MIAFVLNLPYTFAGLCLALVSIPVKITVHKNPFAFVITVRKSWWMVGYMKGGRAMAVGTVVLLGPHLEPNDLEHELVPIEQYQREPFIHPLLYYRERIKNEYRMNKYEDEAYRRAGNVYKGKL